MLGIKGGFATSVDVFYAEGKYPEEQEGVGQARALHDRGLEDSTRARVTRRVGPGEIEILPLVSVGFEGTKTLRMVTRAEPDRVSMLFPDPPVQPRYVARAAENNRSPKGAIQHPGESDCQGECGRRDCRVEGPRRYSQNGTARKTKTHRTCAVVQSPTQLGSAFEPCCFGVFRGSSTSSQIGTKSSTCNRMASFWRYELCDTARSCLWSQSKRHEPGSPNDASSDSQVAWRQTVACAATCTRPAKRAIA